MCKRSFVKWYLQHRSKSRLFKGNNKSLGVFFSLLSYQLFRSSLAILNSRVYIRCNTCATCTRANSNQNNQRPDVTRERLKTIIIKKSVIEKSNFSFFPPFFLNGDSEQQNYYFVWCDYRIRLHNFHCPRILMFTRFTAFYEVTKKTSREEKKKKKSKTRKRIVSNATA